MPKRQLPAINNPVLALQVAASRGISWEPPSVALARWNSALAAKEEGSEDEDNTISVYDPIGFDPWTGAGVTVKRVAAALRHIGPKKDVVVNINSPGGDLFEGLAIYNVLREHEGEVTVRIVGLAASAASVIAMAGDKVQIARTGFIMIHNAMVVAMGNRNDLRDAANWIEQFDDAMASLYSARTGIDKSKIAKLMDKETWLSGDNAIEDGFADELLPSDQVGEREGEAQAALSGVRMAELVMARAGISRTQRRAVINAIKDSSGKREAAAPQDGGTLDAASQATHDAGEAKAVLEGMQNFLNNFLKEQQ